MPEILYFRCAGGKKVPCSLIPAKLSKEALSHVSLSVAPWFLGYLLYNCSSSYLFPLLYTRNLRKVIYTMASHLAVSVWFEQASILEIKFLLISCINVIQSLSPACPLSELCRSLLAEQVFMAHHRREIWSRNSFLSLHTVELFLQFTPL